ncbi:MAG: ATP-binding protein [Pseudomonadota bacterium]
MSSNKPTLHMVSGTIAAGKSTLALKLAEDSGTVLVAEDDWLAALFADQMAALKDYVRCSAKLRAIMGPHVASLLNAGVSVVLDFPANTLEQRAWMRAILDQTNAAHQLHVLNVPDALCLKRLHERNAKGDHHFSATEDEFHNVSRYYVPPSPVEGFTLVVHDQAE